MTFFISLQVFSQQPAQEDVIYLKNGEKYNGEIVLKTDEIVMLKTHDGKRFQFQLSEIKEISKENVKMEEVGENVPKGNFAGLLQVNGGISSIKGGISSSPSINASLAFGSKNAFHSSTFLGVGVGYETIFVAQENETLSFLPLFIQIKSILNDKKLSPAVNLKTGYAFHLQNEYKGGLFIHISGGLNYKVTEGSDLYFGLFCQTQRTYGSITETFPQGTFTSKTNGLINSVGLTTAFTF